MTMQYEQQNINLEVSTAFKSFIFDPSADQSDTTYNDWDAMLEVLRSLPGIKEILIPEGSLIQIPAGTYDMTDIVISGETPLAAVEINDVVFENLSKISDLSIGVGATAANTVPSFSYNDGAAHALSLDKVTFTTGALAALPVFDVSAGSILGVNAQESSFISTNPAVPVFAVDATSALGGASAGGFGGTGGNSWGGGDVEDPFVTVAAGGVFNLTLATGDIFWAGNQVTGPTTVTRKDDYESAVVANWDGTEPLNVKNALDRIAAALGPIA